MRFFTRAILIVATIALATAANAIGPGGKGGGGTAGGGGGNSGLILGFNPDQIAQLISAAGFNAQVVMNGKTKMVKADFGFGDGNFSGAFGIDCNDKGQCAGMEMFVNSGKNEAATPEWINAFNNGYYFVKVIKDKDGNLIFEWDTLLINVSPDDIELMAKLFPQIVNASSDFKP
jgi:putative sensory transduction regulator